jgi:hypothetical protein
MSREFEVEHHGETYWVEVEFDTIEVDDSFDGHRGGYVYTYESSHREVDPDTIEVVSCTDLDGNEVEPDIIPGLYDLIVETTSNLDVED